MKHSVGNLQHRLLKSKSTAEEFSFSAVLSDLFGFQGVFIHHEILPPGRKSSSPHAHSKREELVYVLSGTPTAHLRGEFCEMATGDFIGFPAGERNVHWIENRSKTEVRLLVVASNPKGDEVVYE